MMRMVWFLPVGAASTLKWASGASLTMTWSIQINNRIEEMQIPIQSLLLLLLLLLCSSCNDGNTGGRFFASLPWHTTGTGTITSCWMGGLVTIIALLRFSFLFLFLLSHRFFFFCFCCQSSDVFTVISCIIHPRERLQLEAFFGKV